MSATGAVNAEVPAIDLDHLGRQTLGDQTLGDELLAMFADQAARISGELGGLAGDEPKTRIDLAHTLRGSALAVGAFEVARLAEAYEKACAAGQARPPLDGLEEAVARARSAIARLKGRRVDPPAGG